MKEDIKQQLESLLKAHDAMKKQKSEADAKKKAEQEGFLKEFSESKMAVIEDAMNDLGEELLKHGYNYQISKTGRRIDPNNESSDAESISMILVDPNKSSVRFPTVVFTASGFAKTVLVRGQNIEDDMAESFFGRSIESGPAESNFGRIDLNKVTADAVQRKLLDALKLVLSATRPGR
jgi:hypothetical protein